MPLSVQVLVEIVWFLVFAAVSFCFTASKSIRPKIKIPSRGIFIWWATRDLATFRGPGIARDKRSLSGEFPCGAKTFAPHLLPREAGG